MDRAPGEPPPGREALDAAPLPPEDAAELERRRAIAPDDVTALLLVGVIRSGVHVGASRLRSLFWARPGSPAALRARRRRDRRARRGPRAAQLRGQGLGRLLHDVLRLDLLEVHRPLGGAPRADAEPGHALLDRASACSPRPASPTPSAGAWSPARCSSTSRSSSTASTASSPATRASSPSSARGSTRSSTARRSTWCSPGWRSARAAPATRCGSSPAPRSRCRPRATRSTSRSPSPSTRRSPRRRSRRSRTRSTARASPRG